MHHIGCQCTGSRCRVLTPTSDHELSLAVQEECNGGTLKNAMHGGLAPGPAGEAKLALLFRGIVKSVLHCHQVRGDLERGALSPPSLLRGRRAPCCTAPFEKRDNDARVSLTRAPMGRNAFLAHSMTHDRSCLPPTLSVQMGILHRDIKPDNFLLSDSTPKAIVKLADFGAHVWTEEHARAV